MMSTKEVVETYFYLVNIGNWDKWVTLFNDDIVMDEQLAGHLEGIGTLKGAVEGLKKGYSKFINRPLEVLLEGEKAMALWHIEAANAKGVPIDAKGVNYFIVTNGKISYFSNFHDTVPFKPFTDQNLASIE